MIVDCHAHLSPPPQFDDYRRWLMATGGAEGRGSVAISDDDIRRAMTTPGDAPYSHLDGMDRAGIGVQLLSPRPMHMMHSRKPVDVVRFFTEASNQLVHRHTRLWPDRFIGIAALPQLAGEPVDAAVAELERCVTKLGFRGCILNPDPYENTGPESPALWDRYWYPLWEKLCELGVPCHVHGTGKAAERESQNHYYIHEESVAALAFISSPVLDDFPDLKVVVSHGGGSIPFQIGRYEAGERKRGGRGFTDRLRRIYFDTVLHNSDAVEFLIRIVGPDNCLFGTEYPGLGSVIDPATGRCMDDLAGAIDAIEWLSPTEKAKILCGNAQKIFGLNFRKEKQAAE